MDQTVLVLLFGLAAGGAAAWVVTRLSINGRLARLADSAQRALSGEGELQLPPDLVGAAQRSVGEAMLRLTEELSRMRGRGGKYTADLRVLADGLDATLQGLMSGLNSQQAGVEELAATVAQMSESLRKMEQNVETLAQSAEASSATILEISTTNDEVVSNTAHLATAVEEAAASIEEMTYSIKEVAKNIEDLSLAAEQTSASMNEMDTSISQVESNANATARLSEDVSHDAEKGSDAVGRTIQGIDKIRESTRLAASVINSLGNRIREIGNIVNVIDDVAEQTNLLALNAAIIAAQSGEHGRGFAVVADEIKDLAERTAASTKEIALLIKSVQDESHNAIEAMQQGEKNVEAGVALSREADGALKKILESAQKSTQMVKAIAQATVEQARGSKVVADAVERIAKTVQQVAAATAEQARGSEQIMKSAERMKTITQQVDRFTQEQAKGSKQITKAVESIHDMVDHLHGAHREQHQVAESTLAAMRRMRESLQAVAQGAERLQTQVAAMRQRSMDGGASSSGGEPFRERHAVPA